VIDVVKWASAGGGQDRVSEGSPRAEVGRSSARSWIRQAQSDADGRTRAAALSLRLVAAERAGTVAGDTATAGDGPPRAQRPAATRRASATACDGAAGDKRTATTDARDLRLTPAAELVSAIDPARGKASAQPAALDHAQALEDHDARARDTFHVRGLRSASRPSASTTPLDGAWTSGKLRLRYRARDGIVFETQSRWCNRPGPWKSRVFTGTARFENQKGQVVEAPTSWPATSEGGTQARARRASAEGRPQCGWRRGPRFLSSGG